MDPRKKRRLFNVLRIIACVVALWIVIRGVTVNDTVVLKSSGEKLVGIVTSTNPVTIEFPDGTSRTIPPSEIAVDKRGNPRISYGLKSAWSNSDKLILLLAVLIHFPVVFPQAWRFQLLLRAQSITVGYWECVKLSFAGNFLNFVAPLGSNLGDVAKAYFVSQHTEHKTEAVTTVVLDRVIGLTSLLLVVALITTLSPSDGPLGTFRPYMLAMLGITVVGVLLYFSPLVRKLFVPRRLIARLPMVDQIQRIDKAAHTLAGHKSIVAAAILLTVFLQGVAISAYFTCAVALKMDAHAGNVLEYFTYFYTGVLIQALPGPPQGLGTVELAYSYFFSDFGSQSQIVCMAFAIRLVALTCALPGLLVTLTGSYRPRDLAALRSTQEVGLPSSLEDRQELAADHSISAGAPFSHVR